MIKQSRPPLGHNSLPHARHVPGDDAARPPYAFLAAYSSTRTPKLSLWTVYWANTKGFCRISMAPCPRYGRQSAVVAMVGTAQSP
jgi:hypothetical protein